MEKLQQRMENDEKLVEVTKAHVVTMEWFERLEENINEGTPSRERSIALTHVQTAKLWIQSEYERKGMEIVRKYEEKNEEK